MGSPKISVILTSYNKPQMVGDAIRSVLLQTMGNFELFIMDDNSNEETQQVIQVYANDPRVRYFRSDVKNEDRYKKTRYAVLINQALSMAKGDYISYLTDDNVYHIKRLEMMSQFLDDHPEIQVVYSAQRVIDLGNNFRPVRSFVRVTEGVLHKAAERVDHCSIMHRRKILADINQKFGNLWDDNSEYWGYADAVFWDRLNAFCPFHPIHHILDTNYRTPLSYKIRHLGLPSLSHGKAFIPDGALVKGTGPGVCFVDGQTMRGIKDQETMRFFKFNYSDILEIPDPQFYQYPVGVPLDKSLNIIPNNLLITSPTQDKTYFTQNRKKRLIKDVQSFRFFSFEYGRVIVLPQETIDAIETGPLLSAECKDGMPLPDSILIKHWTDLYLTVNSQLHPIRIKSVLDKLKLSSKRPIELPNHIFTQYSIGSELAYYW